MQLEFLLNDGKKCINTFNGDIIDINDLYAKPRFEKKNNITFFKRVIDDNLFYKYGVKAENDVVTLSVYEGKYEDKVVWKEVYTCKAEKNKKGIIESGDCNLDFWYEFFATDYGYSEYAEYNTCKFSLDKEPMEIVRKVFCANMQENVFLFFKKYSTLRKVKVKEFNKEIFNIPPIKINRNVGKIFDKNYIHYAIQREVELQGEVFFDVTVISGKVTNGIIDIEDKHRYFLTEGYIYSPDGGNLGIFMSENLYGNVYDNNMRKKHPELMLDKYNGKYFYQYFFSKEYIPCFEILAKAGFSEYADLMLDNYFGNKHFTWDSVNLYGKNDKEIFGFKLNKLKNFDIDICYKNSSYGRQEFINFIRILRMINKKSPYLMDVEGIDENLFEFIKRRLASGISIKDIEYIKSLGTSSASFYGDYLAMGQEVGKLSGGLHPKNLKHEHDVMVTYINQLKEAKNNKQFEEAVSSPDYLNNLYEGEKYCILAPRTANDLVNESYRLSHCVKTYIKNVATYSTKIYFLREKDKKGKSLVTVEVRRDRICQVRGRANRRPTKEEDNFVVEWAKEKKLICDYSNYFW